MSMVENTPAEKHRAIDLLLISRNEAQGHSEIEIAHKTDLPVE